MSISFSSSLIISFLPFAIEIEADPRDSSTCHHQMTRILVGNDDQSR